MIRTITGNISFIASIIVFLGALLLAPQAGYAQEIPECDGDEETIITATGAVITTCNWDLDDAPINEAAVGIAPTISLHAACGCEFTTANVPAKEFSKYGVKKIECIKDDAGDVTLTDLRSLNRKDQSLITFNARHNSLGSDRCTLILSRGRFKQSLNIIFNDDAAAAICRADIEIYDAANTGNKC